MKEKYDAPTSELIKMLNADVIQGSNELPIVPFPFSEDGEEEY